ncbi:MAG: VCBS repeat-containing protein [Chitinophagaceae bacterium]
MQYSHQNAAFHCYNMFYSLRKALTIDFRCSLHLSFIVFCGLIFSNDAISQKAGTSYSFKKHVITSDFISEGVAIADVNRDGKSDIIAGAFWFEAPTWIKHEIATPQHYDPLTQFSNSFLNFALDVNQDGWPDQIRVSLPGEEAVWYENPGNKTIHWTMHPIISHAGNESPAFIDMDGDGREDLLCNDPEAKEMIWLKSPVKGDTAWKRFVIAGNGAPGTGRYTHGLGFIDMNADGRKDVVITKGWWECPLNPQSVNWVFHTADLGEECSQIYSLTNNKRPIALVSASAHDYGIWWHEPVGGKDSAIWQHHVISTLFSESHALTMKDVNGDGYPDLVTGKRYFAHNGKDPGGMDAAVLYWFEYKPGDTPVWVPHLIDENSGVGLQVLVQDINKDGLVDIIVANKKGVFIFEGTK